MQQHLRHWEKARIGVEDLLLHLVPVLFPVKDLGYIVLDEVVRKLLFAHWVHAYGNGDIRIGDVRLETGPAQVKAAKVALDNLSGRRVDLLTADVAIGMVGHFCVFF